MKLNNSEQKGFTLVELMLVIVILLLMLIAGGAFILYSSSRIAIERNKRVAVEVANSRLELMRTSPFDDIKPTTLDYNIHYLEDQSGTWVVSGSDPGETVNINGITVPITSTVQYIDEPPADGNYDYLWTIVDVGYRVNAPERVSLETYIGRFR
jgi:prepilin-type N-terminal cleavage/methylation domain-containing protein